MTENKIELFPTLQNVVDQLKNEAISKERKAVLQVLIDYVKEKVVNQQVANLNFICTHNSRRSQFSQIWAQTAADYFGIDVRCFSGGVEVTAFNDRAVASVNRMGFKVKSEGKENPKYQISHSEKGTPILCFSKLFDDPVNSADSFAAVMTCSHADENCPYIPGTEERIPVRFEDPKAFDNTPEETTKYDERSVQIAAEMFYVFSKIN